VNTLGFVKTLGACVVVAVCSACSGGGNASFVAPSSVLPGVQYTGGMALVNGRPVTAARPRAGAPANYLETPLGPLTSAGAKNLEYIINNYGSYASVFDYPASVEQVGTVTNVGGQGCTNALNGYGKKIVWIVAGYNQIDEYKVKDTLVRSLSVDSDSFPSSCAMNSAGDLAVGILQGTNSGDMVIFKHARGSGTVIPTPLHKEYFDGYDDKGNLFFDGYDDNYAITLAEIPKGSNTAIRIAFTDTIYFPGSVQWDGKYLAVTDQGDSTIHRYSIQGTKATLESLTTLVGAGDCAQTWIATGVVYCADAYADAGEVFKYPGGSELAALSGNFDTPLGTVAAQK
jgi:hypothetical protein